MQYIDGPQISSPAVLRRNLVHSPLICLSTSQQATIGLLNSTLALMPHRDIITGPLSRPSVKQDFVKKTTHLTQAPALRPTDTQQQRPRIPTTSDAIKGKGARIENYIVRRHKRTSSSKLVRRGSTALQLFYFFLSARWERLGLYSREGEPSSFAKSPVAIAVQ